jgi:adenine deaminase
LGGYTRGQFLGIGAALAGAFTLDRLTGASRALAAQTSPPSTSGSATAEPDLILINGNVLTSDQTQPRAEAFAVKHGRFVAVGSNGDIRHLATRRTQVIDAQRMTVTPGFIDTHCHATRRPIRQTAASSVTTVN